MSTPDEFSGGRSPTLWTGIIARVLDIMAAPTEQ